MISVHRVPAKYSSCSHSLSNSDQTWDPVGIPSSALFSSSAITAGVFSNVSHPPKLSNHASFIILIAIRLSSIKIPQRPLPQHRQYNSIRLVVP